MRYSLSPERYKSSGNGYFFKIHRELVIAVIKV